MSAPPVLLVIDDDPGMQPLVERAASSVGYRAVLQRRAADALAMLAREPVEVALVDVRMPELGGLDVVRAIRDLRPECGVILTGTPSAESAVDAVKLGALDYLARPLDAARLRALLNATRQDASRRADLFASEAATARRLELCGLIGRSPVMQQLFALIRRIAPHARAALITGERGTGKEGVARAIHELGPRRGRSFTTVTCSRGVETLFEITDAGTLFFDDVGELSARGQATLLRVLDAGDVPILAATSRDLRPDVDAGRFRRDLFCRLDVVDLHVPPLRERREDIPYLTTAFVEEFAALFRKPIHGVSPGAEQIPMAGTWPGNVRELRNVLERVCMLTQGPVLIERDVAAMMPVARAAAAAPQPVFAAVPSAAQDLEQVEREHIARVLADLKWNKQAAARRLGISRRTLYRRLERHRLRQTRPA